MSDIQLPEPTWWLTHDVLTKRNRIDRMPIQSLQPGVMQHTAMYTADEVAAILADREKRAQAAQGVRVADIGFRWDGEAQQHVPNLLLEFDPVPFNGPTDAKGWKDRDTMAHWLSTEASKPVQAEAPTASNERLTDDEVFALIDKASAEFRRLQSSVRGNMVMPSDDPKYVLVRVVEAALATQQEAQPQVEREPLTDEDQALDLLETLFDAYENGVPCHEDGDQDSTFIGHAFRLDDETFHTCADLLNRRRPRAHGFTALPAPIVAGMSRPWWEVLGVHMHATPEAIQTAYRKLASEAHPDKGGTAERMAEINRARDEGLAA